MPRALLLAALLAVPLAAAQGDSSVEREGWTQYVPNWQEGPASVRFGGDAFEVPANVTYATDNRTFFYASSEARERLFEGPGCGPGEDGLYVLVSARPCTLVRHPSVACSGTDACGSRSALPPVLTYALDSCGRVQHAKCTPGLPLALVVLTVAGAALSAPWRGRGRA
ncbi:MAG TPA: hypothetical protein VFH78_15575 [Candidatus Thermoplasmatota archaeon]|nr:hypothetical protein [Candidatus Thermoplasmatota archaeon]